MGVVGVSRDITDHKREEDALRQREAELAQLSRVHVVGEMAAALAHELNQPLYAINNYVGGIESRLRQLHTLPESEELLTAIVRVVTEVGPRLPLSPDCASSFADARYTVQAWTFSNRSIMRSH